MARMNAVTIEALAAEFSDVLRSELTEGEMAEVLEANAAETDPSVCHSHDYIDANMSMLTAYCACLGIDERDFHFDASDQATMDLWNEAWDLAKASAFPRKEA